MKLAVSNLAWDKTEDGEVLKLLEKFNISAIEVAASKIWENPTETSEKEILEYKKIWEGSGIKIVATTSLLFGHPELQLFTDADTRQKTRDYLSKMINLSSILGAKAMVFGSPKNRITNGLPKEEAEKIAIEFFNKIGETAQQNNVYFGIEPNPPLYGTDFINTTQEAINLVKKVNSPNFSVHLDASTMTINKENYVDTINSALPFIHHMHISEPGLKPIPTPETDHQKLSQAIKDSGYSGYVSIEMPLNDPAGRLDQLSKTLKFITSVYK